MNKLGAVLMALAIFLGRGEHAGNLRYHHEPIYVKLVFDGDSTSPNLTVTRPTPGWPARAAAPSASTAARATRW